MKAECRNDMAFAMFFLPTDVPGLDLGTPLATTVGALRSASLTSLHVVGTSTQVIWKLPAPWATLTCLSIDGGRLPLPFTQLDAMSVMNSCPKLIECSLEFHQKRDMIFPISFQPPQPLPLHSITLPDLRALRLSGENPGVQGLPSRLVLPSLKSLSITFSHSLYPSNSAMSTNVEWIKEHGDKLSNATIVHASLIPSALLECLNGLPNVVDLTLLGTSAGEGDEGDREKTRTYPGGAAVLDDSLISRLTPGSAEEGAEAQSCLCPQLQRLTCKMGAGERNEEAILKMVLARYGNGRERERGCVRRIEEVILSYTRPRSLDIVKELEESGVI